MRSRSLALENSWKQELVPSGKREGTRRVNRSLLSREDGRHGRPRADDPLFVRRDYKEPSGITRKQKRGYELRVHARAEGTCEDVSQLAGRVNEDRVIDPTANRGHEAASSML